MKRFILLTGYACAAIRPTREPESNSRRVVSDSPLDLDAMHAVDPCNRLCEEFSASNRGNGFDLCDDPQGSACVVAYAGSFGQEEVCLNIYWNRDHTTDQVGLVYETDPSQINAISVTCHEAEAILGDVPEQVDDADGENHSEVTELIFEDSDDAHEWHTATQIFVHLPPVTRTIRESQSPETLLRLLSEYHDGVTTESTGSMTAPAVEPIIDYFAESIGSHVMNIINNMAARIGIESNFDTLVETELLCSICGEGSVGGNFGPIRLRSRRHDRLADGSVVSLQQLFDHAFYHPSDRLGRCPNCPNETPNVVRRNITEATEVIAVEVDAGMSVSLPQYLNVGEQFPLYRLVAIAHEYSDGHTEADIQHYDHWYRTNGTAMTLTNIHDGISFNTVSAAFYVRT